MVVNLAWVSEHASHSMLVDGGRARTSFPKIRDRQWIAQKAHVNRLSERDSNMYTLFHLEGCRPLIDSACQRSHTPSGIVESDERQGLSRQAAWSNAILTRSNKIFH